MAMTAAKQQSMVASSPTGTAFTLPSQYLHESTPRTTFSGAEAGNVFPNDVSSFTGGEAQAWGEGVANLGVTCIVVGSIMFLFLILMCVWLGTFQRSAFNFRIPLTATPWHSAATASVETAPMLAAARHAPNLSSLMP